MTIPTEPGFYWMRCNTVLQSGVQFRWQVIEVVDVDGRIRMVDPFHDDAMEDYDWGERLRGPDEPEDLGKVEIPRWLQRRSNNLNDQVFVLTAKAHVALCNCMYFDHAAEPDNVVKKQQTMPEWIECRAQLGIALGFDSPPPDVQWRGFASLLEEAQEIADKWSYPDRVHLQIGGDDNWLLVLSTGGWSENEDLIYGCSTMFRACCWIAVRRGGHHVYGRGDLGDAAHEALMSTVIVKDEETT